MHQDRGTPARGTGAIRWAAQRTLTGTTATPAAQGGFGPDPACQPCPACGGLECLCRPRFFAGQLLTEQDMNRLDHYIIEKNKLHNRHLFGPGVVCGLVATCAPCDDRVNVSAGYALSPCGEDIVVCAPDSVDICELISACRDTSDADCRPYAQQHPCDEEEEEWILAIRYAESPSRPQTPVTGSSGCRCGAGGCKGAGCSCGGTCGCSTGSPRAFRADAVSPNQPRVRRGAPPTCEPSVICEGYRYDVFRNPDPVARTPDGRDPIGGQNPAGVLVGSLAGLFGQLDGDMAARITCCLRDLERALPRPPTSFTAITPADRQAWFRWFCAVRSALIGYFARVGGTNCEAMDQIGAIPGPNPALPIDDFRVALTQSLMALVAPGLEAMLHCICINILPPCPLPADPRVPLAIVTVRKRDCHIIKVCNWTPLRQHVVTFPTLGYWLGWLPIHRILRQLIERICCATLRLPRAQPPFDSPYDSSNPGTVTPPTATPPANPSAPVASFQISDPAPLDFSLDSLGDPALLQALFRQIDDADAVGGASVTNLDLLDLVFRRPAYPTGEGMDAADRAAAIDRLAGSGLVKTLAGLLRGAGDAVPSVLGMGMGLGTSSGGSQSASRTDADIAELKQMVAAQAAEIAQLKNRLDG